MLCAFKSCPLELNSNDDFPFLSLFLDGLPKVVLGKLPRNHSLPRNHVTGLILFAKLKGFRKNCSLS